MKRHFIAGSIGLFLILIHSSATQAASLYSLIQDAKGGEYLLPSATELSQTEELFMQTLDSPWDSTLQSSWQSLGFEFFETKIGKSSFGILREQTAYKQGRGFYVFRKQIKQNSMLQVPHSYTDLYTRIIGAKLMRASNFQVAAWATVPRIDVDLSHTDATHFQALTRAFGQLYPSGRTVQIHGFSQSKRSTDAGRTADVILSNGTTMPNQTIDTIDACLTQALDYSILTYPDEVTELGGTTNDQGQALRSLGNNGFIHLEMSYPLRVEINGNKSLRRDLRQCLENTP